MIIVNGKFQVGDAEREALLADLRQVVAATREEEGCISFDFAIDINDSDRLLLCEVWENAQALEAHMATPHMLMAKESIMPHFVKYDVARYVATIAE